MDGVGDAQRALAVPATAARRRGCSCLLTRCAATSRAMRGSELSMARTYHRRSVGVGALRTPSGLCARGRGGLRLARRCGDDGADRRDSVDCG